MVVAGVGFGLGAFGSGGGQGQTPPAGPSQAAPAGSQGEPTPIPAPTVDRPADAPLPAAQPTDAPWASTVVPPQATPPEGALFDDAADLFGIDPTAPVLSQLDKAQATPGNAGLGLEPIPDQLQGQPVELPAHPRWTGDKIIPATAARLPDGRLVLDGAYVVRGSGTKSDPYVLPWGLIVSASEVYQPRRNQVKLPQRLTMFDGAFVTVAGFTAYPLGAESPRELLLMLNQWDGCCIGIPPTAHDAVEVRLLSPATTQQRLSSQGTVSGLFRVEPFEDQGFLLGLYLIEDASLQ
ncbi:MAG: hypothetical protein C0468_06075 [Planctomyces sp.]|nr:hypothetical protein [Planctomyces sp.]